MQSEPPIHEESPPRRESHIFDLKNVIFVAVVLLIAGAGFYFLFNHWQKSKEMPETEPAKAIQVPVVPVESRTLFREDQIPGEIEGYQDVLIYPKVPGLIKWIGIDRGS